jgi:predicted ATPase/Flp pilus assembly protein TadD
MARATSSQVPPTPIHPVDRCGGEVSAPVPLTPLIGRQREAEATRAILLRPGVRLLTLTGPGGVGKTRLAIRLVEEVESAFAGGVFFIALGAINDADLVAPTVGRHLGVGEMGNRSLLSGLATALGRGRSLLVLDNLEQVLGATPFLVDLLVACPSLTILATSRTVLRVSGEHDYAIPPLALPDPGAMMRPGSLARLAEVESVGLFLARARAVDPGLTLTELNAAAIVDVCRRLDGLPLAIELAAAQCNLLQPQALRARLERRLPLLTRGPRDLPARLRTMRDAIAWSYDLLPPSEQALSRRLSVFAGGFSVEAAEAVGADLVPETGTRVAMGDRGSSPSPSAHSPPPVCDVLAGLGALVDHSLIGRQERLSQEATESTRFVMLETVREYGLEQLHSRGEDLEIRQRHATHFLSLATRAGRGIHERHGVAWLDELEVEHDNLRAALRWWLEQGDVDRSLKLPVAMALYWRDRGHLGEGLDWLERALVASAGATSPLRAEALDLAGDLAWIGGEHERAVAHFERSLAEARAYGDAIAIARGHYRLGAVALARGDYGEATTLLDRALEGFQTECDAGWIAAALVELGLLARAQGDREGAVSRLKEALSVYRDTAMATGQAWTLRLLGIVVAELGNPKPAAAHYAEALRFAGEQGNQREVAYNLECLAGVAESGRQPERAVGLYAAAEALRTQIGAARDPIARHEHERTLSHLRTELGNPAFMEAWKAGQSHLRGCLRRARAGG